MVVQKKIETYFQAGLLMVFSPQFPSFQLDDGVKLCLSMHKIVTTSCLISMSQNPGTLGAETVG